MNALLEAPAHKAEAVSLRHYEDVRKANGSSPNQSSPIPLWLEARAQTIDFRRDDLERTHWKKVCCSMQAD